MALSTGKESMIEIESIYPMSATTSQVGSLAKGQLMLGEEDSLRLFRYVYYQIGFIALIFRPVLDKGTVADFNVKATIQSTSLA